MGNMGKLITTATDRVHGMAVGLLKDMDHTKAARMPEGINCNHPVFVYGHLAIYPQMIMQKLGMDPGKTAVPESYNKLFMHGVDCLDDVDGTIYPPLNEVAMSCGTAYMTLVEVTRELDDEQLVKELEDGDGFKDAFGTYGGMIMFLTHDHCMFHFGQISTWRRAMGLGSAM